MSGITSTGAGLALRKLGLMKGTDHIVGASVGAIIAAYMPTNTPYMESAGASLFWEEALTKEFLDFHRFRPMNVEHIMQAMRGEKDINYKHLLADHAHRTTFWAVAANKSGEIDLINAMEAKPDVVSAIQASCSLQGLYAKTTKVNGIDYWDSGIFNPLPLRKIALTTQANNFIILQNRPRSYYGKYASSKINPATLYLLRHGSLDLILSGLKYRNQRLEEEIAFAWSDPNRNFCFWHPDDDCYVESLCRDKYAILKAFRKCKERAYDFFARRGYDRF